LGESEKVDYILASEPATLVWLANLACIELHQMHSRAPHFDKPEYMAFDLDPPEGFAFRKIVELALALREMLENTGYHCFVKTTGGKGVHILAPLEQRWSFEQVFEASKQIAQQFVDRHKDVTTLELMKKSRGSKVLVDIYRNRTYQTIVCPYSVRGRPQAPVSMPLGWEELQQTSDPSSLNIRTVLERVQQGGDVWEAMGAYATRLHTDRKVPGKKVAPRRPAKKAKKSLEPYGKKRAFTVTPEPPPRAAVGEGDLFVIHRHHATRLHYDLRLERDGVLRSWAVPKGLPPRPGIKRLAVNVEDHPLDYGSFEGTIPAGQYGAGPVWIFARGKYTVTKDKSDSFYFRLQSVGLSAEFRLIHTKGKDWLLERLDAPQVDWLRDRVEPMLSEQQKDLPAEADQYIYEIKWDGIRALFSLDEGQLTIRSRNHRDITSVFPELNIPEKAFRASGALLDGEIACLDEAGKPVFEDVLHRLQQTSESGIARARASHPAVCYLFDCLYLDGRPLVKDALLRRREYLQDLVKENPVFRISEAFEQGRELYEAARQAGLEGIVAKKRDSAYLPGVRGSSWIKIKAHESSDFVIVGYTDGKGERGAHFGSLQLGRYRDGRLEYAGRVGTGFDQRGLDTLHQQLRKLKASRRPFAEHVPDESKTTWVEPKLCCEVRYASLTKAGIPRAPVFVRLRPDVAV
jgi:DNA ligase D-like protein (predicted ligase)/DNA ligase D-like protein (predicted polymerase)/DNA ligase D-like protein (predicted 3'-phosphoesterase)